VHDEILVECAEDQDEKVKAWLEKAIVEGWIRHPTVPASRTLAYRSKSKRTSPRPGPGEP
jgi:hypothetical protein